MSAMSNYLENEILDHVLGTGAYTHPSQVYIGLATASFGEGNTGTELSGNGYARQAINFSAASGGTTSNNANVDFPAATASWNSVSHYAFSFSSVNNFIKKYINLSLKEIVFMNDKIFLGCDNCYFGNIESMYKLIHHFHYNLDVILEEIGEIKHQETLVMIESSKIFNSSSKFTKQDVLNYINKINNKDQALSNHKFINYALNKVV